MCSIEFTTDALIPGIVCITDLMSSPEREAARAAGVQIFWVMQPVLAREMSKIISQEGQARRLRNQKQGGGKYLLHAMFLSSQPLDPLDQLGDQGDIWISEPNIHVRLLDGWKLCQTEYEKASSHPFLERQLTMHPKHCSLQWVQKISVRQHWNKDWTQEAMEKVKHPGVKEAVASDDMKAIIGVNYHVLSSAQVSHFMARILLPFVPLHARYVSRAPVEASKGKPCFVSSHEPTDAVF